MHSLRFDELEIFITEKMMEFCGRFNAKQINFNFRSKKRVKWEILHQGKKYEIYCSISFTSGKKKIVQNGLVIQ